MQSDVTSKPSQTIPDELSVPPPPSPPLLPPLPTPLSPRSTRPQAPPPANKFGSLTLERANGDIITYIPTSIQDRDQFVSTFLGCNFDTARHYPALKPTSSSTGVASPRNTKSEPQSKLEEKLTQGYPKKRKTDDGPVTSTIKKARTDNSPTRGASILVGNLTREVDNSLLYNKFSFCTGIIRARVIRNRPSQLYGFVDFETAENAKAALEEMQDTKLAGHCIRIEIARRGQADKREGGRRA